MPSEFYNPDELDLVLAASEATPPLGDWSANAEGDVLLARWINTPGSRGNARNVFGIYPCENPHFIISGALYKPAGNEIPQLKWYSQGRAWVHPEARVSFPQVTDQANAVVSQLTLAGVGGLVALVHRSAPGQIRLELFRQEGEAVSSAWIVPRGRFMDSDTPYNCRGFELPLDRLPVYTG
jgi:hypothetical protein